MGVDGTARAGNVFIVSRDLRAVEGGRMKLKRLTLDQQIAVLRIELAATKDTLGNLIVWMSGSANSPIRIDEAQTLMRKLHGKS
jgi:hypothetical protein